MKNKGLSIVIGIYVLLSILIIIFGIRFNLVPVIVSIFFACSAYVVYVFKKYIEKQNEYYTILIFN